MHDDGWRELLQRAEPEQAGDLRAPANLAERARGARRRRGQRRRRTVLAGSSLMVLLLAGLASFWNRGETPLMVEREPASAESIDERIAELKAEAERHMAIARHLMLVERRDRAVALAREAEREVPAESVEMQVDLVAYRMIVEAESLQKAMRPRDQSISLYREVVRLFPTTWAAEVARERLSDLGV